LVPAVCNNLKSNKLLCSKAWSDICKYGLKKWFADGFFMINSSIEAAVIELKSDYTC